VLKDVTRLVQRKLSECVGVNASIALQVGKGGLLFTAHPRIPGLVPGAYLGLHFRMSMLGESGWQDETGVRTGISGRNTLRWLPTERLSERRDSDCECWANCTENARVEEHRIFVCVSLLPGKYLSDFL